MSVTVTISWPDGATQWASGTPIIDAAGVGPLSAGDLGAVIGLLTGAGCLRPLDEDHLHFEALVGRELLAASLTTMLLLLEPMGLADPGNPRGGGVA